MKNFIKINRALAAKKRFLSFLAMSAVVLGMAFTFNACGGNNPEEPANPSNPEEPGNPSNPESRVIPRSRSGSK